MTLATLLGALTWASIPTGRELVAGARLDYASALGACAAAVAWLAVLWFLACVVLTLLARLPGLAGTAAQRAAQCITPALLRHLVEATLGVALTVAATAHAANAGADGVAAASEGTGPPKAPDSYAAPSNATSGAAPSDGSCATAAAPTSGRALARGRPGPVTSSRPGAPTPAGIRVYGAATPRYPPTTAHPAPAAARDRRATHTEQVTLAGHAAHPEQTAHTPHAWQATHPAHGTQRSPTEPAAQGDRVTTCGRLAGPVHEVANGDAVGGSGSAAVPPPDRPVTKPPSRHRRPESRTVVVRSGDTLWEIAARRLPGDPTAQAIAAAWPRWYAANREVVGPDPDVIHPGQHLHAPKP